MSQDKEYSRDFRVVKNVNNEEEYYTQLQGNNFEEETAIEYIPQRPMETYRAEINDEDNGVEGEGRGTAALAVILSIASLFFWHLLLGALGVIVGFIAIGRGRKGLGYTAVVIGAFSIIVSLFDTPFIPM